MALPPPDVAAPVQIAHDAATTFIDTLSRYPIQAITMDVLQAALALTHRGSISYWDAAIVAAAQALGCRTLLTEDLQHGQDLDGVQVVNPFL